MSERPVAAPDPEPGVSLALATERARTIHNVRYELAFSIPAGESEPVSGHAVIRLELTETARPLVLDFTPGAGFITSISVNGRPSAFRLVQDHIVIPGNETAVGENAVEIVFRAGDAPLNRSAGVHVHAVRAGAGAPRISLLRSAGHQGALFAGADDSRSVAGGCQRCRRKARRLAGGGRHLRFAATQPIPTYLFAFAAGKFQVETAERGGRTYRLFHRETDAQKVARNREAIFDLHASSLAWLERYTAIPYRFGKFDFVAIPSFQFGGMEHPGAIFYNAPGLFLDESATENQVLRRAAVVAHETSHMWFGDLVTMRWFDDVWLKEVFANFMAAKIVNPSFPKVNHELRFLVAHYPSAYSVDRTAGTHPIRQAAREPRRCRHPVRLHHLRQGADRDAAARAPRLAPSSSRRDCAFTSSGSSSAMRPGRTSSPYSMSARRSISPRGAAPGWRRPGGPSVRTEIEAQRIAFVQADPRWIQHVEVLVGTAGGEQLLPLDLRSARAELPAPAQLQFVLPTGGGLAYGDFTLDAVEPQLSAAASPRSRRSPVARRRVGHVVGGAAGSPGAAGGVSRAGTGRAAARGHRAERPARARLPAGSVLEIPAGGLAPGPGAAVGRDAARGHRARGLDQPEVGLLFRLPQ